MRVSDLPLRLRWTIAALLLAVLAGAAVTHLVAVAGTARVEAAARSDVRLRAALLDSEIARFRLLPLALADDRDVVSALRGDTAARTALNTKLETLAAATGAPAIYVVGGAGRAIAASNWRSRQSFVGNDYRFRRYFRDARRNGTGSQFAVGTVSRRPGLYLAHRSVAGGVVVVKLAFDQVEAAWRQAGGISYVTDAAGVVLVTSRPAWRFAATRPLSAAQAVRSRADALLVDAPLPALRPGRLAMVAATAASSQPGWRLTLLVPAAGRRTAVVAGSGAALAVLALAALAWMRRERAEMGARRTAELEQAVAERTAALRHEIDERAAGEARAAELREGLRQANRLATLGQVTAGVAHETAQPVAAIRTFAQTSALLLDRGDAAAVHENLSAIARLADRIGAVTTELRGFARRRPGEVRPVRVVELVEGALLILREQLRPIALDVSAIEPGLAVIGGKVRLEQVLVNLLQNAAEALAGRPDPRIALVVVDEGERVRIAVADNGPGVPAAVAARLFTPFVTSRPEGLGLGLVIAHDIAVQLGGTLTLASNDGGARFELTVPRA